MWNKFKKYINSIENGSLFTRRDILWHACKTKQSVSHGSTIDVYKRCAELHGIISTTGRGTYVKLRDIPIDMSSTEFREKAYTEPLYKGSPSIFDYL